MNARRTLLAILTTLMQFPVSALADDPSPEYREALRKTIQKREERRRRLGNRPVGLIVPYPMPPALIIRQTPEAHDEVGGLLRVLRGG